MHVDEVDDDDAADVAQPDLLEDLGGSLEVRLVDGVAKVRLADVLARVDIDDGQRLGLVDNEEAARLELDLARAEFLDLLFDVVRLEDWRLRFIEADAVDELRRVGLNEAAHALVRLLVVDDELVDVRREAVAHEADEEVRIAIEQR